MTTGRTSFCVLLVAAFISIASFSTVVGAQTSFPTSNILERVLMIQTTVKDGFERGTIFSIDVDGREYWITAKHIITGAKHPPYGVVEDKVVHVQILNPNNTDSEEWIPEAFSVIDTPSDVDIVVLAPHTPLLTDPVPSLPATSAGLMLGGDCEFLGFPYGGGWSAKIEDAGKQKQVWMPFVKHCAVSAFPNEQPRVWILDGINNEGFSGGPVIFDTGPNQKLFAVISGYHTEPTDVIPVSSGTPIPESLRKKERSDQEQEVVNVNSGFIIAYDIEAAIEAIHKHPIGPLRTPM